MNFIQILSVNDVVVLAQGLAEGTPRLKRRESKYNSRHLTYPALRGL